MTAPQTAPVPNEAPAVRTSTKFWPPFALFFLLSFAFSSWLPRLPALKTAFDLSVGDLGLVLLALPAGSLTVAPVVGFASTRLSLRHLNALAMTWMLLAVFGIGFAGSAPALTVVLFFVGLGSGAMGVAMNAAALATEQSLSRPILSRCHAMYSLGLATGSLAAGIAASVSVPIRIHLGATCAVVFACFLATLAHVSSVTPTHHEGPRFVLPSKNLRVPAVIAMVCLLAEGAALDWSSVFLTEALDASGVTVGAGVTIFAGSMAVCRAGGDAIAARLGSPTLIGVGAALASSGYVVIAVSGSAVTTFVGFALTGLGLANIVPVASRLAAARSPEAPGVGLAATSTLGYAGFLAGPPLVGLLAEASSLRGAFVAVAILVGVIALLATRASLPEQPEPPR